MVAMKDLRVRACIAMTIAVLVVSCKERASDKINAATTSKEVTQKPHELLVAQPDSIKTPEGMVWVSGVEFTQGAGAGDALALPREKPAHPVAVDGFFIDQTEVTNAQFEKFVDETGYVTLAERPVDWEAMKKTLPPGTPKPADSLLQPGSLIFDRSVQQVTDLNNYTQWWEWKIGANWKHPQGPESTIEGKANYPVVHISYEDALAYCKWANRRLPTETEWEAAAYGKLPGGIYTWGDDATALPEKANTWQGTFPTRNSDEDGFAYAAPVGSYAPNSLGIYDLSGNVWELTQDWFSTRYYQEVAGSKSINPQGAVESYNPENPYQPEKVIKGGSFLCDDSYCASYRISARMGQALESSSDHSGFRTVADVKMLQAD